MVMAVWEIRSWEEVEVYAAEHKTCIAPGKDNHRKARRDFKRPDVRYIGYSALTARGYIRIVILDVNGISGFVDSIAPFNYPGTETQQQVYGCVEAAAEMMRRYELSHFYIYSSPRREEFFADRKVEEILLDIKRNRLPRHSSILEANRSKTNEYIDLYS